MSLGFFESAGEQVAVDCRLPWVTRLIRDVSPDTFSAPSTLPVTCRIRVEAERDAFVASVATKSTNWPFVLFVTSCSSCFSGPGEVPEQKRSRRGPASPEDDGRVRLLRAQEAPHRVLPVERPQRPAVGRSGRRGQSQRGGDRQIERWYARKHHVANNDVAAVAASRTRRKCITNCLSTWSRG